MRRSSFEEAEEDGPPISNEEVVVVSYPKNPLLVPCSNASVPLIGIANCFALAALTNVLLNIVPSKFNVVRTLGK